jgi:hypothetical protein
MGDPVSTWARHRFDEYFADGKNAFATVVQSQYNQHKAMAEALIAAAQQYGLTEDLIAAGLVKSGPAQ